MKIEVTIVETLLRMLKTRATVFRILFKTSISPKPNLYSAFFPQDSDVGPMGGRIDVLGFETGHGCAGVWVRGLHHIFQVDDNIPFLDLVDEIVIVFFLPFLFFLSRKLINSSQFVRSWTSMEHDSNWEPKVGTRQCLVEMSFFVGLVSCL